MMKNKYRVTIDIEVDCNSIIEKRLRESVPKDNVEITFTSRVFPAEYLNIVRTSGKLKSIKKKVTKFERIC